MLGLRTLSTVALGSLLLACGPTSRGALPSTGDSPTGKSDSPSPTFGNNAPSAHHTVFVNFDGVDLTSSNDDDSRQNRSSLGGGTVPAFDHTPLAPMMSRDEALGAIILRLTEYLAPYDVNIVTRRPQSGDYSMILVGGSGAMFDRASYGGVSPIDCDNSNKNNISFVFTESLTMRGDGLVGVAALAAHEVGHAFGLEHTDNPVDLMYSVAQSERQYADTFRLDYDEGMYSNVNVGQGGVEAVCDRGMQLDNRAILASALGKRTLRDTTRPTLTWTEPSDITSDPKHPTVSVAVEAADEQGVARVEVYKNYELVAVVDRPPYEAKVPGVSGEPAFVAVEAIDMAGNRTLLTRRVTIR